VRPRALLLDYAGVLTGSVADSFATFERAAGIPDGRCFALLVAGAGDDGGGLIGAIERGELPSEVFDARLRALLEGEGHAPPSGSLLAGLFADLAPSGPLWTATRQLRQAGVRTGLLSNSWGTDLYPREALAAHFDAVVISGEVGMRKPEAAIFHLACARLGVEPADVVFVDDLVDNVRAAERVGMAGVHHVGDHAATLDELAAQFAVDLDRAW
jgi:putative hydrolase of the HAD superfamily